MRYLTCLILLALVACNTSNSDPVKTYAYTNDLINETSPYLLQHAHNPVNWKAWNPETLQQAREEGKLMIISIGYAACHWCHVMERETFEDSTAATVMNDNFIPVKVDREERPDVDQIYINAVQLMTGNAGWPLNVITLPDGRPIWGGTYFKKDDWIQAITQIQELYDEEPQRLEEYASRLEEGIKTVDLVSLNTAQVDFKQYDSAGIFEQWSGQFDTLYGGFKRAPKFMMPNNWAALMRQGVQQKDDEILAHVKFTLDKMAYGGIYDQVGGGFARYSVDERWHVPHFEKMLYDNAQLVSLYSAAYQLTGDPLYQQVVEESLIYIEREMTHPDGNFYSSLDADSETESGELEEGAYYIYSKEELQQQIGNDFELFANYYNINDYGLWEEEGKYVLIRTKSHVDVAQEAGISADELMAKVNSWKSTLLNFRDQRIRPRLDDKSLTSWNALMLKGYVDAYKTFGKEEHLQTAIKNGQFIQEKQLQQDGRLWHSYKDGQSTINGYLEDYAATIEAFIALYEVTLDMNWLNQARSMANYSFDHFFDAESGMFFFTSDQDDALMNRTIEYRDNVIPASNSTMAKNLFVLGHHFDETRYGETAMQMLKNVQADMETYPNGFSNWLDLLMNYQENYYEIVTVGDDAQSILKDLNTRYIPNKLIAGSTSASQAYLLEGRFVPGKTFIYVCVNNACKLPVMEVDKALELLE
ncbi:thioredoxin domain-containing protein [Aureitalea marina]|uniref:Thioredoxin domain-containing protein n=1 Tax=Aureitalea marina TaxID=930804 RepID=A0A2S7KRB3_9FLAO|nr:thioredoxin domain-containing protein [Aureitalea marina]PQB05128.1 thioredoxin domain-containing protein [Aureitalea marina]